MLHDKHTHKAIAARFGVSRQAIGIIKKRSDKILLEAEAQHRFGVAAPKYTRRTLTAKYPSAEIDKLLFAWLLCVLDKRAQSGHHATRPR